MILKHYSLRKLFLNLLEMILDLKKVWGITGLKKAHRSWFEKFWTTILSVGFSQSSSDYSLFLRQSSSGITILLIYVDDMIITKNDEVGISHLKNLLHSSFKIKDLEKLIYFLGLEVSYGVEGIKLSQQKYAKDLVKSVNLTDHKKVHTPMEVNTKYKKEEGEFFGDQTLYRRLVGSLIYLTMSYPDISYAV